MLYTPMKFVLYVMQEVLKFLVDCTCTLFIRLAVLNLIGDFDQKPAFTQTS